MIRSFHAHVIRSPRKLARTSRGEEDQQREEDVQDVPGGEECDDAGLESPAWHLLSFMIRTGGAVCAFRVSAQRLVPVRPHGEHRQHHDQREPQQRGETLQRALARHVEERHGSDC